MQPLQNHITVTVTKHHGHQKAHHHRTDTGPRHAHTDSGNLHGALLDAVSLDDWREVVTGAVQAAKGGDPQARNWLGQYLIGRPESKAPTPINVIVNQLQGHDPVVDRLATPFVNRHEFPSIYPEPVSYTHLTLPTSDLV